MAQTDDQNSLLPEGNGISDGSGMKRRERPKSLRRSVPFEVRMPQEVSDALREVSRRQFTTAAEYVRRALLAQLRIRCYPWSSAKHELYPGQSLGRLLCLR